MSAILQSGTVAPAGAAAAPAAAGGFFAHHGFWAPGVRLFRALGFATKAVIISLVFVLPFLGLLGWQLMADAELAMQDRMDATRQHVEVAHGVLAWAQAQEAAGTLTREQAQAQARQLVSGLRYEGNEYFWINDMQQRMVMHAAKPDLDGKDMSTMKDPNGLAVFGARVAGVDDEFARGIPGRAEIAAEGGADAGRVLAARVDGEQPTVAERDRLAVLAGESGALRRGPVPAVGRTPGDVDIDIARRDRIVGPEHRDQSPGLRFGREPLIPVEAGVVRVGRDRRERGPGRAVV